MGQHPEGVSAPSTTPPTFSLLTPLPLPLSANVTLCREGFNNDAEKVVTNDAKRAVTPFWPQSRATPERWEPPPNRACKQAVFHLLAILPRRRLKRAARKRARNRLVTRAAQQDEGVMDGFVRYARLKSYSARLVILPAFTSRSQRITAASWGVCLEVSMTSSGLSGAS